MQENDRLNKKRIKWKRQHLFIILGIVVTLGLIGSIAAKYLFTHTSPSGQVTSSDFYFTADLLGDTKMVPTEGEASDYYAFGTESTEGTWQLYGGSQHIIEIYVQNYYDSSRIQQTDITYSTDISVVDKNGNSISFTDNSKKPILNNSSTNQNEYVMKGGQQETNKLILTIPPVTDWNYEEGTVVTVEIKSTKPYEKTLKLNFHMFASDATLKYRVTDTNGSPYAQLVIMTNIESGGGSASVQPYIEWPETLSIDNTNKLTFTRDTSGNFVQQQGIEERKMQISESLPTGRSETIYFFKKNVQKNYSVGDTVVMPSVNGQYTIDLKTLAGQ